MRGTGWGEAVKAGSPLDGSRLGALVRPADAAPSGPARGPCAGSRRALRFC